MDINVFYSTFTNVFYFCRVFTFLTFFYFFITFLHLWSPVVYLKARSSDRSCFFIHRIPHPTGGRAQPSSPSVRRRHTSVRLLCTEDSACFQNAVSACIDDISVWMRSNRLQLRPPSHQTKTMKTALRTENLDERSAVVVKKEKMCSFRIYTTYLLRPGQVLTAPNTSLSGPYYV